MKDAKEWAKVAENIVKTRYWLYQLLENDTIDTVIAEKIRNIRYMLMICIEEVTQLAEYDDKGWL